MLNKLFVKNYIGQSLMQWLAQLSLVTVVLLIETRQLSQPMGISLFLATIFLEIGCLIIKVRLKKRHSNKL